MVSRAAASKKNKRDRNPSQLSPHQIDEIIKKTSEENAIVLKKEQMRATDLANVLICSFSYKKEFMIYLVDQLLPPFHRLVLSERHNAMLESNDDYDNLAFAAKCDIVSHVHLLNDAVSASKLIERNIPVLEVSKTEKVYRIKVPPIRNVGCSTAVVYRSSNVGKADNFLFYFATICFTQNEVVVVINHCDKSTNFQKGDKIDIVVPPLPFLFEALQEVVACFRRDQDVISKFFGKQFPRPSTVSMRQFFDPKLDEAQCKAVNNILSQDPSKASVILGARGTGKTFVLYIAAKELYKRGDQKILICTQSNENANFIAKLFLEDTEVSNSALFRAFSPQQDVPDEYECLYKIAKVDDNKQFYVPGEKLALICHDIIITTMDISASLRPLGKQYFTHIFMDGAGNCGEFETMIPIAHLASLKTRVTIFGDEKLPKYILEGLSFNPEKTRFSSGVSRLSDVQEYKADSRLCLVLHKNYRSHPDLVKIVSHVFYQGLLESAYPKYRGFYKMEKMNILDNQKHPIRFHVSYGQETVVEKNSGVDDTFNSTEIEITRGYIQRCVSNGVKEADIAVITPYRGQMKEMRQVLGQEFPRLQIVTLGNANAVDKDVVILSLTRSNSIGILKDEMILNYALSAAKLMFIVIGKLSLLEKQAEWRKFAKYLSDRDCIFDPKKGSDLWVRNLKN